MKSRGRVAPAHAIALLPLLAGAWLRLLSAKHGLESPSSTFSSPPPSWRGCSRPTLEENLGLSASFLCGMLAIGFLDPLSAFLIPFVAEGVGWLVERYRPQALIINWAGLGDTDRVRGAGLRRRSRSISTAPRSRSCWASSVRACCW